MTDEEPGLNELLERAITGVLAAHGTTPGSRGVVTAWTLSISFVGDDGCPWLGSYSDDRSAPWLRAGMLISALDDVRDTMRGVVTTDEL